MSCKHKHQIDLRCKMQVKMKCSTCNRPLSVPPIYYKDSVGSICGRCSTEDVMMKNNEDAFVRQRIFEDIAKYLSFPCSYQVFGCTAELKWGSVEHHEDICIFKNFMCPLSHEYFRKQCPWIDEHKNLADHMRKTHKNLLCSPPTLKITKKFENRIIFWEITGRVIIIILAFKSILNKYFCYIIGDFTPEHCSLFQCQVSIFGNDHTTASIIQNVGIQPFDTKNFEELKSSFQIEVNSFKHLFSTTEKLLLEFTIAEGINSVKQELNEKLLCQLECPVCFEYMKAPIYICRTGHNFCESCSFKIDTCPICRGDLLGGRNFTLEALTSAVVYPCAYKHFGCSFVALLEKLRDHERYCTHIGRKCFIEDCDWKGLHSDLLEHLANQHSKKIHQLNTIYCYSPNVKDEKYLIIHNNDIFLLKISFEGNQLLKFAVLNYEREITNYGYEFQIMGFSAFMNITLSNRCQPVPFHADIMTYENHEFISLPLDFIHQFLINYSRIKFKLNIDNNVVQN